MLITNSLISVLILSYNHCNFVEDCILSAINQQENNIGIEVIIIDDGSTDGTVEIIERLATKHLEIQFLKQPHEGVNAIARNFNRLISLAKGKYISFLSSDDVYLPHRFEKQIELMEIDQQVQFVYSNGLNCKNGISDKSVMNFASHEALRSENPVIVYKFITENIPLIFIQGILIRNSFLTNFKPFNENLIADDWVFNILIFKRLLEANLCYCFLDISVFIRNVLPERTSGNFRVHWQRIEQVIDTYIADKNKNPLKKKTLLRFIKRSFNKHSISNVIYFYFIFLKIFLSKKK